MTPEKRIWTIPNVLTFLRLFTIIPILIFLSRGERWLAFLWIIIGIAADFLDGIIARKLNQSSDLGRIMDPLVDKLIVISVTFHLVSSQLYNFPLWYFIFLVLRELSLILGGLFILKGRKLIVEANRSGKNSAFLTGVAILLFVGDIQPFGWIVLWTALGFTVFSTWVYLKEFREKLKSQTFRDN